MTTPRYPSGCSAGSQVPGDTSGSRLAANPDYAWIVNFNHGNVNNNHRDNNARVRAVRVASPPASECQGVSFRELYQALRAARRGKQPSANQLAFTANWGDGLIELQHQLNASTWSPRPTTCFVATRPKAREIHAPDFADRVVHHWLVPQLEAIYEPGFIADSFANRAGKGTHAAVRRLRDFVRQVYSGQSQGNSHEHRRLVLHGLGERQETGVDGCTEGRARGAGLVCRRGTDSEHGEVRVRRLNIHRGWYLQLDIANFFNSIHRPTLWALLKPRLQRAGLPMVAQRTTHALLRQDLAATGCHVRATAAELALVPAHKRLANAPVGFGLPIGNLSSQFFANVYLDQLDQFVKHILRARRYLRYVDDFILVHHDREQLQAWQTQLERFLAERLRLRLKPDIRLRRLTDGIDFLGYVVFPTHTRVRPRVVRHAQAALRTWADQRIGHLSVRTTPRELRALTSTWSSYAGHFQHANSHELRRRIHLRFPWLAPLVGGRRRFHPALDDRVIHFPISNT